MLSLGKTLMSDFYVASRVPTPSLNVPGTEKQIYEALHGCSGDLWR
jgi:hypothetical protein